MSAHKPEAAKPPEGAAAGGEAAGAAAGGGIKAWLPLILSVVLMPALAYATTMFLVVPKIQHSLNPGAKGEEEHPDKEKSPESKSASEGEHGGGSSHGSKEASSASGKNRNSIPIEKVLVNISGSMGTRYLLAKFTLVSDKSDFKSLIEKNTDQLRDMAMGILGAKTISDLEKPGARNVIRSEMISAFNGVLGTGMVQEIFFTEFAIQ